MKIGKLVFARMCGGRTQRGPWFRKDDSKGDVLNWRVDQGVIFDRFGFGVWHVSPATAN